jgi:hypothetical protein
MNMDTLTRNGKPQTWLEAGTILTHDRDIRSIQGNRITFDVPLADSFDAAYLNPPGTIVAKYTFPGRIEQVGVESLRVTVPAQDKPISEAQYTLLSMNAAIDGWVRDVVSVDTHNSTTFGSTVRRVTIERVHIQHTLPFTAPAAPADVAISGTQILLDRSSVTGEGVWPVVTQGRRHGAERCVELPEHHRRHRAASALGGGPARRQQRAHGRLRSPAEHRVLEPRVRRIGPRVERRLGGRVECEG